MFRINISSNFSAAHQLNNYKGRCEKLHGHNWKVNAEVSCAKLDSAGMVIDFHKFKQWLNRILKTLDHEYLNDIKPFKAVNPTSENIAKHIFDSLLKLINNKQVQLESVSVWETDTSCATYTREKK